MTHPGVSTILPIVEDVAAFAAPMAEVYNTDRFSELHDASQQPPMTNLGLAACFLQSFFQYHNLPFAFLGGWAIFLRGSNRVTNDIDVTVQSTMDVLERALLMERRVCIPQTHGQTSIQIFIHTGGEWDRHLPSKQCTVSADLIIGGYLGTPGDLRIGYGMETIRPTPLTPHGLTCVPVVSLAYQLAAKFQAHGFRRRETTNDFEDLIFLICHYPEEVWSLHKLLDLGQRELFWDDVAAAHGDTCAYTTYVGRLLGLLTENDELERVGPQ